MFLKSFPICFPSFLFSTDLFVFAPRKWQTNRGEKQINQYSWIFFANVKERQVFLRAYYAYKNQTWAQGIKMAPFLHAGGPDKS